MNSKRKPSKLDLEKALRKNLWSLKTVNIRHFSNNKNGKVILVKLIAKSIFSSAPLNPGAIRKTKSGIKSSINKTIKNKIKTNKLNIFVANLSELYFPFFNSDA